MKNKKRLGLRIKILYVVFFICTIAGVFFGTTHRSIESSLDDYEQLEATTGIQYEYSDFIYSVSLESSYDAFSMPLESTDSTIRVSARPSVIDLKIEADGQNRYAGNIWSAVLNYTVIVIPIVCYLIMLTMLVSLARNIRKRKFFSRRNIRRVRWLAILQILYSVCNSLYIWVDNRNAAALLAQSGLNVATTFTPDYWQLIIGMVILFIGEVFSIGYELTEEQEFTI